MAAQKKAILYFDTSALKSLGYEKVCIVLAASKQGKLQLVLSEWVVYEYARQAFQREENSPLSQVSLIEAYSKRRRPYVLQIYHLLFKEIFLEHGVRIIKHSEKIQEFANKLVSRSDTYFTFNNNNDRRDALILASALEYLDPKHSTVICEEKRLSAEFARLGYTARNGAKEIFKELSLTGPAPKLKTPDIVGILRSSEKIDFPKDLHSSLLEHDEIYAQLFLPGQVQELATSIDLEGAMRTVADMGKEDIEVRLTILSFIFWFAPISKADLMDMLAGRQMREPLISSNIVRLVDAKSIRDTGTHLIPGQDGVCDAVGESRIDELLDLMNAG